MTAKGQQARQWYATSSPEGHGVTGRAGRSRATAGRLAPVPDVTAAIPFGPYPTPQREILSPWSDQSGLSMIAFDIYGTNDVLPISRATAMSVPAIAKGRHVICPQIASRPLRELQGDTPSDPQPAWLTRTNGAVSPWHRMMWTVDDVLFSGWSLWQLTRGYAGVILAADRVDIARWKITTEGTLLVDERPVSTVDHILIPGPHEGILTYGRTAVNDAATLNKAASNAAKTPSPTLELHQTGGEKLTDVERDDLISIWAKARRGENAGVGFTSQWVEVKEHKSIAEALLVDGRNAAAVECARILGIAAAMIDATVAKSSLTYETQAGRGLEHTAYGLEPYMDAIAARLSLDDMCARGKRVAFDIAQDVSPAVEPTGPELED